MVVPDLPGAPARAPWAGNRPRFVAIVQRFSGSVGCHLLWASQVFYATSRDEIASRRRK